MPTALVSETAMTIYELIMLWADINLAVFALLFVYVPA
jgi:hypothetical protein